MRPRSFCSVEAIAVEWLPFGGGLRKCIGAAFALYEMKMVLAAVLTRCRLSLVDRKIEVVRRSITLTPSDGLRVTLRERRGRLRAGRAA
ncbi:MAG: cytochrome P450 [Polyangiaceae bacterium]